MDIQNLVTSITYAIRLRGLPEAGYNIITELIYQATVPETLADKSQLHKSLFLVPVLNGKQGVCTMEGV